MAKFPQKSSLKQSRKRLRSWIENDDEIKVNEPPKKKRNSNIAQSVLQPMINEVNETQRKRTLIISGISRKNTKKFIPMDIQNLIYQFYSIICVAAVGEYFERYLEKQNQFSAELTQTFRSSKYLRFVKNTDNSMQVYGNDDRHTIKSFTPYSDICCFSGQNIESSVKRKLNNEEIVNVSHGPAFYCFFFSKSTIYFPAGDWYIDTPTEYDIVDIQCSRHCAILLDSKQHVFQLVFVRANGIVSVQTDFVPITELIDKEIIQIQCSKQAAFCRTKNGEIWVSGININGQMGIEKDENTSNWNKIEGNFKDFATAMHNGIAVNYDNEVFVWGSTLNGHLGIKTSKCAFLSKPTKVSIPELQNEGIKRVIITPTNAYILTHKGRIWVTGENQKNQCMIDSNQRIIPEFTEVLIPSNIEVFDVAAFSRSSIVFIKY